MLHVEQQHTPIPLPFRVMMEGEEHVSVGGFLPFSLPLQKQPELQKSIVIQSAIDGPFFTTSQLVLQPSLITILD